MHLQILCGEQNTNDGCNEITEHSVLGKIARCTVCGHQRSINNDTILKRLREIDISLMNIKGREIMLKEEEKELRRWLVYIPVPDFDVWKKSDFELHCYKCNRITRWMRRGKAECHEGCLPGRAERIVTKRKITGDDLPADIIALLLGGDNIVDQDDATLEVIKATGRKIE